MAEINRRDFVRAGAASAVLVVLGAEAQGQASGMMTVTIGKPEDFPANTTSDRFANSDKILIAHHNDRIYAMTALCTHRNGMVAVRDGKFRCLSHGSVFSDEGKIISGPAKNALARYAIVRNEQGILIVDKSKKLDESRWNDPEAFFSTKASV